MHRPHYLASLFLTAAFAVPVSMMAPLVTPNQLGAPPFSRFSREGGDIDLPTQPDCHSEPG
jgi:hypothetical protein